MENEGKSQKSKIVPKLYDENVTSEYNLTNHTSVFQILN